MELSPARLLQILRPFPCSGGVCLALSGGVDSHVLLHLLARLGGELGAGLRVLHCNHGLQPQAKLWATHCVDLCRALGVPIEVLELALVRTPGASLEAEAREARYLALGQALRPGELLLTAQHQDDQAETVLLQLLRGSGPRGLAAMPELAPFAGGYLGRPLLGFGRRHIEAYAREQGLGWIEDASNQDLTLDRNFLRHQVIPLLRQRWPGLASTLSRSARHCAEAQLILDEMAEQDRQQVVRADPRVLDCARLAELAPHRGRSLLRYWLRGLGLPVPNSEHLEQILVTVLGAAPDRQPKLVWPGGEVRRFRGGLHALEPLPGIPTGLSLPWPDGSCCELPRGLGVLGWETGGPSGIDPASWRSGRVEVRFRTGGESCRPQGKSHTKTLKHWWQELGVPPWERGLIPLVFIDGRLAAVADLWVCEPFTAAPGVAAISLIWTRGPRVQGCGLVAKKPFETSRLGPGVATESQVNPGCIGSGESPVLYS